MLHYVERRTERLAAELGDLRRRIVRAVDGDVRHPVRRNPFHLRAELIEGAYVFAVLRQRRIDAAHLRRQRRIFELPAEEPGVKLFGRVLIARSEFEPAEIARRLFHLTAHGIFSLLKVVDRSWSGKRILSQIARRVKRRRMEISACTDAQDATGLSRGGSPL